MKLFKNYRLYTALLSCLLALGGVAGYAQSSRIQSLLSRPQIKILLSGMVERGGKTLSLDKAGRVDSGEVLDWTIVSENSGEASASSHDAIAQIPAGTTFVAGSTVSEASAVITYSIDGGKNFLSQPTIASRQADGSVKQIPAPASMYTQIRYHWDTPLTASSKRVASYKVRVR